MLAKVTTPFNGRPDDEVMTRSFRPGDIVTGDLAQAVVTAGWAEEMPEADLPVTSGEPVEPSPPAEKAKNKRRGKATPSADLPVTSGEPEGPSPLAEKAKNKRRRNATPSVGG